MREIKLSPPPVTKRTVLSTFPPAEYHFLSYRASASFCGVHKHRNLKGVYRIHYSSPIGPRPSFVRSVDVGLYNRRPCGASASADRKLRNKRAAIVFHSSFHVIMILFSP